jgi:hypothetical protein
MIHIGQLVVPLTRRFPFLQPEKIWQYMRLKWSESRTLAARRWGLRAGCCLKGRLACWIRLGVLLCARMASENLAIA